MQKHKFLRFFRDILRKNTCKCFALAYFYLYFNSVILIKIREVGNLLARIYDFAAISRRKRKTVRFSETRQGFKCFANSKIFAPYNIIQARKLACGLRAPCFKKCYRQIYLICRGVAKGNAIYEFYE